MGRTSGPYASRPGYGAICEAVGGVRHMTGDPDRPPARVALATTDYLTASYAAFGAAIAILDRVRSGRGQVVDVALYETAFTQMEPYVPAYEKLGIVPMREGPNLPSMAPNSLYPTKDGGYVLIAANSNPTYERLVRLMQQPELLTDPRFATIRSRGEKPHMQALDATIAAWTRQFEGGALEVMLQQAEVPATRVYTIADIFGEWNKGDLDSYLIEISRDILGKKDEDGQPLVDKILDTAGQKGTGKWTVINSQDLGIPITLMAEAVYSRCVSALKDERVKAARKLKGPRPALSMVPSYLAEAGSPSPVLE